jgi:hypothetical protein
LRFQRFLAPKCQQRQPFHADLSPRLPARARSGARDPVVTLLLGPRVSASTPPPRPLHAPHRRQTSCPPRLLLTMMCCLLAQVQYVTFVLTSKTPRRASTTSRSTGVDLTVEQLFSTAAVWQEVGRRVRTWPSVAPSHSRMGASGLPRWAATRWSRGGPGQHT